MGAELSSEDQRQERQQHWNAFRLDYLPQNILEVFPDNALQDLLRGFFLKIHRGVTILYGRRGDDNHWRFDNAKRIDPFDAEHDLHSDFLNPICSALRHAKPIQDRCIKCDRDHAIRFTGGNSPDGATYLCWLGLFDVLYPVKLDGQTIAFVFAGQIPPDDGKDIAELKSNLRAYGGADAEQLIASLQVDIDRRRQIESTAEHDIETTRTELRTFVTALERIMADLYAASQRASVSELLDYWDSGLPTVDHIDEALWWQRVATLAEEFLAQIGVSRVKLLVRAGKYFDQQWPAVETDDKKPGVRVAARDVLQAIAPDQLVSTDNPQTKALAAQIGSEGTGVYFYRTRAASADAQPGLLFVTDGQPLPQFRGLGEQFLRRVSSRTEYAALTFQLKRMHEQYKLTVADTAHDLRNPLQNLLYVLAELSKIPAIQQDEGLMAELEKQKFRVRQAQEQTFSLQDVENDTREIVNLVELLDEVMEFMMPRAAAHPCPLKRYGHWPDAVHVRANRGEIFRVFLNLIDNAIKYSFMGPQYAVDVQLFPVDRLVIHGVKVTIRNFGIGIPADQLNLIRTRGERAEVRDTRLQREGTGIGLSIVNRFLKDHEGTFDIESKPEAEIIGARTRKRTDTAPTGLRYATTVTVRLKAAEN